MCMLITAAQECRAGAGAQAGKRARVRRTILAFLGGLVASVGLAGAAPSIAELLAKVRADQASYKGVRQVHFQGPQGPFVVRQKVYHAPGGRVRFEVLSPPSMAGRLHVSDGRRQWQYDPHRREVKEMEIPQHLRRSCGRYGQGYPYRVPEWEQLSRWRQKGEARVAGRACYVLTFLGHDNKPTMTVYVDSQQFTVLGLERRSPAGRLVEAWKFESVEFPPTIDPKLFTFTPPAGTRVVRRAASTQPIALPQVHEKLRMRPILPTWLPNGYRLVEDRIAVVRRHNRDILWIPFSNGAETFSLFQSFRLPPGHPGPPKAARWDFGPYTLLVVGKLTPKELEAMRKSLREWSPR